MVSAARCVFEEFVRFFAPGSLLTVSVGRLASAALGFLFIVLAARLLGPQDFGLFSFAFGLSAILAEITGYGLETALVRLVKAHPTAARPGGIESTCRAVLRVKVLGNGGLFLVGMASLVALPGGMPEHRPYAIPIAFALLTSVGASLWRYALAVLQAQENFRAFSVVLSVNNVFKVLALGGLYALGGVTLTATLALHAAGFFFGFLFGLFFVPSQVIGLFGRIEAEVWARLGSFSKWVTASSTLAILNYWLSSLILGILGSPQALGEFSAAFNIGFLFDILLTTAKTVFFPRVCSISNPAQYNNYIKDSVVLSVGLSVCLSPLVFFARPLILVLYASDYLTAAAFVPWLFPGFAATLMSELILLVLLAINRPESVFRVEAVRLVFHLVVGVLMIAPYGAQGAVAATVATRLFGSLLAIAAVRRELKGGGWLSKNAGWRPRDR